MTFESQKVPHGLFLNRQITGRYNRKQTFIVRKALGRLFKILAGGPPGTMDSFTELEEGFANTNLEEILF